YRWFKHLGSDYEPEQREDLREHPFADAGRTHPLGKSRGASCRGQCRLDGTRHRGGRSRYFHYKSRSERDDSDVPAVCYRRGRCCRVWDKSCHLHDFRRDLSGLESSSPFQVKLLAVGSALLLIGGGSARAQTLLVSGNPASMTVTGAVAGSQPLTLTQNS